MSKVRAQENPSQKLWVVQIGDPDPPGPSSGCLFQVHMSKEQAECIRVWENARLGASSFNPDRPPLSVGEAIGYALRRAAEHGYSRPHEP